MADLLIVDDDADMLELLADFLRGEGHDVRVAHDGAEGFQLIRNKTPDLVLLDVEMPIVTGPEMAHELFVHNVGLELIPLVLSSGILSLHQVAATVGTDDEPPVGVLADVVDAHRVFDRVEHVVVADPVSTSRSVNLHTAILYYEMCRGGFPGRHPRCGIHDASH